MEKKRNRTDYEENSPNNLDTYDNPLCCNDDVCLCHICFETKKLEKISPCKHYICKECIDLIVMKNPTNPLCPICRNKIMSYGCNTQTVISRTRRELSIIPFIIRYLQNNDVDEYNFSFTPDNIYDDTFEYFDIVISESDPLNHYVSDDNVYNSLKKIFEDKIESLTDIYNDVDDNDFVSASNKYRNLKQDIMEELIHFITNSRHFNIRDTDKIYATIYRNLDNWYEKISAQNAGKKKKRKHRNASKKNKSKGRNRRNSRNKKNRYKKHTYKKH